ncbi:MAG: YkgJ family cysteine cluster protein [Candidatus Delongbacteria bacterium]|nr:YkgJ family cysteine cluster protein [Candidatus Delongbacteria bacterium]MCG2760708.1 YkgJ family cysteine cluster protein [Candidatus Delongbacteria bacterium]
MNNIPIILPSALINRKDEFDQYLLKALERVRCFAEKYGWTEHIVKSFMDKVIIFDSKSEFDKMLLELTASDPNLELPETFCGALEERVLAVVTPEIYSTVYPQGVEDDFYTKILAHEIAHRLHIRILNGENIMNEFKFPELIKERCISCSLCCKLFLINLNEKELNSGVFQTELSTGEKFDDFEIIEEYGLNIVKKNEDGTCFYIMDKKCSIYNNRPQVCKDFFCGSDKAEFNEMIEEINNASLESITYREVENSIFVPVFDISRESV